jgi:siroheme synthase
MVELVTVTVAVVPAELDAVLGDSELEEAVIDNARVDDEVPESGQPPLQASTEQQPLKPP